MYPYSQDKGLLRRTPFKLWSRHFATRPRLPVFSFSAHATKPSIRSFLLYLLKNYSIQDYPWPILEPETLSSPSPLATFPRTPLFLGHAYVSSSLFDISHSWKLQIHLQIHSLRSIKFWKVTQGIG